LVSVPPATRLLAELKKATKLPSALTASVPPAAPAAVVAEVPVRLTSFRTPVTRSKRKTSSMLLLSLPRTRLLAVLTKAT
jgi:hypothetical protein